MRALVGGVLISICALVAVADESCVARGPYLGATTTEGVSVFAPGVASTQYHDDWPPVFSNNGREVILRLPVRSAPTTRSMT